MNLPAVILFICFSAVYGLQETNPPKEIQKGENKCKHGLTKRIKPHKEFKSKRENIGRQIIEQREFQKEFEYTECHPADSGPLCVREEYATFGEMGEEQYTQYACAVTMPGACKDRKEGECYDDTKKIGRGEMVTNEFPSKVCCSSDSEFEGVPSKFSDGQPTTSTPSPDTTSSSAVSTPVLLVAIIALLGLTS